ncbi:MAG: citrate/2-methylcitrate synthase, partial [Tepidisphaeraceae bacterium]
MSQAVSSPGKNAGLEGVVAAPSEICFIDGVVGRLVYRGYEIGDLVENTTFEETAFLLWESKLPNRTELGELKSHLADAAVVPAHTLAILKALPSQTEPMDALRTAASSLSSNDPDLRSNEPPDNLRKAIRLTAQFPMIVAAFHRIRSGQRLVSPARELSIAGNFLYMLTGVKPHETLTRVLDAALVLHAEHGFNAST